MQEVEMTDKKFSLPNYFSLEEFFEGCVGIIANKEEPIEQVVVKVYGHAHNYLATLPIHASQTEIARDDESVTYLYKVRPNYDFFQALLQQADQVEVLSPQWVQEEMKRIAKRILSYYKK